MKISNFIYLFVVALGITVLSSCGEDLPGSGTDAPSLTLSTSSFSTVTGDRIFLTVTAAKGNADLNSFAISANGVDIDASRVQIDNVTMVNNPTILFNDDVDGFTYEVSILTHSSNGSQTYTFKVIDKDGLSDSATATVDNAATPPSLVYNGTSPLTVAPGTLFGLNFNFVKGSSDLYALEILEDGQPMDETRILRYESPNVVYDPLNSNYFEIADDAAGASNVKLQLRASAEAGEHTYTIVLEDSAGLTDEEVIIVNSGNAVLELQGVLFNAAGPTGTGGLDLDEGTSVGSNSALAEIKDLGIDQNMPDASNWKKQITGANGTELKYMIAGQDGVAEGFTYAGVAYQEQLVDLWSSGTSFTTSFAMQVGDVVLAKNADKYYLLSVVSVNETATGNGDNYVFDIKL
jgi:hypothetical protein